MQGKDLLFRGDVGRARRMGNEEEEKSKHINGIAKLSLGILHNGL
jgi:hypothetical protein